MVFRGNRESRNREAAGRSNWPEAVPRKMLGRKRGLSRLSDIGQRSGRRCQEQGTGAKDGRRVPIGSDLKEGLDFWTTLQGVASGEELRSCKLV